MKTLRGKNATVTCAIAVVALFVSACGISEPHFSIPVCDANGCRCFLPGFTRCGDVCVNTSFDHGNCGACGKACDSGEVCASGSCGTSCGTSMQCDDRCQYDDSPFDCGSCGTKCDFACVNGACLSSIPPDMACTSGLTACSNACVDTSTDDDNCGGCGLKCPVGSTCYIEGGAGMCCSGQICNNVCSDPQSDSSNCGSCGNVCDQSTSCNFGVCQ